MSERVIYTYNKTKPKGKGGIKMSKKQATAEKAMEAWEELAFLNTRTDYKVNDLLEKIAGSKYLTSEADPDDPIYHTILNLTTSERREFLKGCERIKAEA